MKDWREQYDDVWSFCKGRAKVYLGDKSFWIDRDGNEIKEEER